MKRALAALLALASFTAIACGDSEALPETAVLQELPAQSAQAASTDAPPTPIIRPSPTPEAPESPAEAPAAVEAVERTPGGGVFRRLMGDPPTLDPHLTGDTTSAQVVVEVFSGLVTISTDLELIPDIAHRWDIDEGGTVYTFHLRDDVNFHNGKPVTAGDFKWSVQRAAAPETASPVADAYLGDIVGYRAYADGDASEISGIQVVDDLTLRITIDAPKAYFLAQMTYPTAYVLDQETVEAGGRTWWIDNPVGTGPFKLAEFRIGERIVLERNDDFYREPADIDRVIMNMAGGQSMAMYENDELDITGVGLQSLERVLDPNEDLHADLVVGQPGFSIFYIGLNAEEPPLDDRKFRQALSHAIDKRLIAEEVLSQLLVPAYGILPPGFPGFNPNLKGLEYDPELARSLLAESKYADPETRPRIVVTTPGTGGGVGLDMEVVIAMWENVLGVTVEIQQVEWATYLDDLDARNLQAYAGSGWQADYPDPQDFLDVLFHSESTLNHVAYGNEAVDALLVQARTEQDVARRIELYHEAEQMIVNDAPIIPLWYDGEQYVLVKPHVKGYRLTPMSIPRLKQLRIEQP